MEDAAWCMVLYDIMERRSLIGCWEKKYDLTANKKWKQTKSCPGFSVMNRLKVSSCGNRKHSSGGFYGNVDKIIWRPIEELLQERWWKVVQCCIYSECNSNRISHLLVIVRMISCCS